MSIEQGILSWVHGTLSRGRAFLGGLPPCPYAAEAMLRGQVRISTVSNERVTLEAIDKHIAQGMQEFAENSFRVHVIAVPVWDNLPVEDVQALVQKNRNIFFKKNLWLLYDHPLNAEVVQDFCFNHGSVLLFFIQKLSDLVQASEDLQKTKYYDQWPAEYKEKVLAQRARYYRQYLALQVAPSFEIALK